MHYGENRECRHDNVLSLCGIAGSGRSETRGNWKRASPRIPLRTLAETPAEGSRSQPYPSFSLEFFCKLIGRKLRRRCCAQAVGTPFANTPFANRYAAITFPTQKTKYARDNTSQTKYRVDATGSGKRTPAGKPSRKLSSKKKP